ncbi:MAG TPA: DUF3147 family protein [Terriglobales bacterium]|nr:DUF3147 family protein [Terriglobales bacterium]
MRFPSKSRRDRSVIGKTSLQELLIRFLIGGFVVSVFSVISDLFKPKTFAGLFGAAPSVALASLGLTVMTKGTAIAAIEARSMIIGGVAFFVYAVAVSYIVLRFKTAALPVAATTLLLWLGVALGLCYTVLGFERL